MPRPAAESEAAIRTPDQRLRVFVSSTLGELAEERRAVARAISALRLTPVLFELGARPHPPRDVYRAYLEQSDVFIGLYWQRYGELAPGMEVSGLEDELDLSRGLPRLLYIKTPAPDREPRLADLISRIEQEASYRLFGTPAELGRLIRDDVATLLSERFAATPRPPPTTWSRPRPLPVATTSLVGRDQAIDEVAALVARPDVRLVTLTGPGGIGKTRLAVAVGQRVRDRFGAGVVLVELATAMRAEQVLERIGQALGVEVAERQSELDALVERFGNGRWLIILDNLEQVVGAARDLDELLSRCPGVAILATSRRVLRLMAERAYPVSPLPPPPEVGELPLEDVAAFPAVALFVDRARAVRPDFALTAENVAAVAGICRRLEGMPLAIELAAARARLLDPPALLRRLATSLDALGMGTVEMPERQHTLRATVEWSVGLLDDAERSMLETAAVFVDGWTIDAAADVAGLDEDRALDLTDALARDSLVYVDMTPRGPRVRMLDTIHAFVSERLTARADCEDIQRRHAEHYRALVERTDGKLRRLSQHEWARSLEAETSNLSAAIRWYLANDPASLPHLVRILAPVRILWPYWGLRHHTLEEGRVWVAQLLAAAGSFDTEARAELLWTSALTALEAGDRSAALETTERLAPLLSEIDDPQLRAVSHLVFGWTASLVDDLERAIRETAASVEQLRGLDEPLWTALALVTLGSLEMATGRYEEAGRDMRAAQELAQTFDNVWITGSCIVQLGALAVARGRLEEARSLLEEGLRNTVATGDTYRLTLCLVGFARLALAEGDAEQAALVTGAAEGLRQRVGRRSWTALTGENRVVAEVRRALPAERFDLLFAAGTNLRQEDAVDAVRDHWDHESRAATHRT